MAGLIGALFIMGTAAAALQDNTSLRGLELWAAAFGIMIAVNVAFFVIAALVSLIPRRAGRFDDE